MGDLVVLKRVANDRHKLSPPCKGPYEVVGKKSPGRYLLKGVSPLLRDTAAAGEHLKKWYEWYRELCDAMINGDNDDETGEDS
ncbi:hypothetical protein RI129_004957 [Pyrocoelia pectoralis]|uniref:Uncharacterized protein n=1 Tax=Pyrocoelia pectoralis TaxID=417401 RepID=A0AAN7ZRA4_9COLE